MFTRIVLAYVLALPFLVIGMAGTQYNIAVTMSSSVPGMLQVFYFSGNGAVGGTATPLKPGETSRVYRLQLPPGDYQYLRIDPGTAPGRSVMERVAILETDGSTRTVIPLTHFVPNSQVSATQSARRRLALESGGNDPQLLYTPRAPLQIRATNPMQRWLAVRFTLYWAAFVAGIWLLERVLGPLNPVLDRVVAGFASAAQASPRRAIVVAACLSTIAATYPVVFLGRSFVAPNNGGSPQLYDSPPFAPGSLDTETEDVRGSDTAATLYQFVPYSHIQREALALGELPLWNRHNAAGRPLWGQGQSFLLDPLHWFTLFVPDPSLGWDLKFIAHRFVFALGAGLVALAATGAWLPAVIVAVGTPFIGLYGYRLNHPASFSLTYAPWVLLASIILSHATAPRSRLQAAILLSVAASLVLVASPPKEAIVMLVGLAAIGLVTVLRSPGNWVEHGRRLGAAAAAAIAMILLTAPHWLVFLDCLKQSIVPPYDNPYVISAGVPHAIALSLSPLVPGRVLPGLHPLWLVLGLAAICSPNRLFKQPALLGCAISAAGLLTIAFGVVPDRWIVRIPFIASIGHIDDVFITAALVPLLVLSAAGASALLQTGSTHIAVVTLVTCFAAWWLVTRVGALAPQGLEPWLALFELTLAAALPWCFLQARRCRAPLPPLLASLATMIVLLLPGGLHAGLGVPAIDQLLVQPRLRPPSHASAPALRAVHRITAEPARTVGVDWSLVPGIHALYELEGIGGADALQIPAYEELMTAGGVLRLGSWFTPEEPTDVARVAPLLDMLNVRSLMVRPDLAPPGFAEVALDGTDRLRVERRDTAWPRAFFVDGITTYAEAADLVRQVAVRGTPFAAVQSSDQRAIDATRGLTVPSGSVVPARKYTLTVNTTTFDVRATSAGVAVLSEPFLPDDFRATLNGQPVPYFRVNHAFKAVSIPAAGDWVIRFEYRPARWGVSWVLAAAGVMLLTGLALAPRVFRS